MQTEVKYKVAENPEFDRLVAELDPTVVPRLYQRGESALWTLSRPGGFTGLGNVIKLSPIRWGYDSEFLSLLEEAKQSAIAAGADGIWGPLGYSTYFDYRLKVAGFDVPAFPTEPTNTLEHVALFARAGFSAREVYHSHEFELGPRVESWIATVRKLSGRLTGQTHFEQTSVEEILAKGEDIYRLTDRSFAGRFGYEPIGAKAFCERVLSRLLPMACFHNSFLLKDGRGRIQGYSLNLRDPRDPRRLLLKTTAFSEDLPDRARLFFELMHTMLPHAKGRYDRAVFCLASRGTPADRFIRRLKPRTIDYATFYCDLRASNKRTS